MAGIGESWYFGQPKSKTSKRNIFLSPLTVALLAEHKKIQEEEKANAKRWSDYNLIFCNRKGNPESTPNLLKRHFRPILEAAGLPPEFRMYDLRHSCATLLLEKNINPKIVQERLGHSSITLTLNTYSHVTPGMQELARDALDEAVFSRITTGPRRLVVVKNIKDDEAND